MSQPVAISEIFARVSMLQFVVEELLAAHLSRADPASSEQFRRDFVARFDNPRLTGVVRSTDDEQAEAWSVDRMRQMAADFIECVAAREQSLRQP